MLDLPVWARTRVAGREGRACALALSLLALAGGAPAARAAGSISFEEAPPSPDVVRSQYCNGSVSNRGVEFLVAGRIYVPSVATSSPSHAFTNRYPGDEFGETRTVEIRFTAAQSAVSMTVGLDDDHATSVTATLRAWSDPTPGQGTLLATSQVGLGASKTAITKLLGITRPGADVRSVELEFLTATASPVFEVMDDLAFSDVGGLCISDTTAPVVTITAPASDGQSFHSQDLLLGFVAEDTQSGVASVRMETFGSGGAPLGGFDVCGRGAAPPCIYEVEPTRIGTQFTTQVGEQTARIRVTADDFSGRSGSAERTLAIVLPGPNANLWAQGIEVTQAIQEWVAESPVRRRIGLPYTLVYPDTATSFEAAPLVADRTTVARVYAGVEGTAGNVPLVGVKATLRCQQAYAVPCPGPAQLVADRTVEVRPNDTLDAKRRDAARSWNFVLPDAWTKAGSITLEAEVNAPDPVLECAGCADGANALALSGIDFVASPDFRQSLVYMLRIDGVLQGVTTSPTQAQMDPFFRYLRRAYPIDDATVHTAPDASWTYTRAVPPEVEECWKLHSALVTAFKTNKQGRRAVQGFAAPWSCSGTGGGGAAYTNVISPPNVVAEEIGHAFGLNHAGPPPGHGSICPPVGGGNCAECLASIGGVCDTDWPWAHGTIGGFGFDVLDPGLATVFAPGTLETSPHDFMSYGGPTHWISQRTWTRLINAFNGTSLPYRTSSASSPGDALVESLSVAPSEPPPRGTSAPAAALPLQRYVLVRGVKDPALGWLLLPAYEEDLPVGTDDHVGEGDHRIELVSRGRVVAQRDFSIPLVHVDPVDPADLDSGQAAAPSFAQLVPIPDGVDVVQLREARTLVATRTRSPSPPALVLYSPTAAGFLGQPSAPRVVWEATDADGDPLFARVDYLRAPSEPGTESWQPLALDHEIAELPVDLATLPGGASARARVTVTDGLNTTSVLSEAFFVPGKPPVPEIVSPDFVGILVRGQRLVLVGTASDLEEGVLPPEALEWTSSLDGFLGTGRRVDASALSVGVHFVTLEARDASGEDAVDVTTIFVLPAPNVQPIANAGPDRAMALGGSVVLDGLGSSDADGDPLTFAWTIVATPPGSRAVLSDRTAAQPLFGGAIATGDYAVELVVQDGKMASTPDTVVVHVGPPPNDGAGAASPVPQGETGGTLGGATSDGSASVGTPGQPDVWFRFTPPADGLLRVNTCGSHDLGGIDGGPDTVVSVHSGAPGTVANEIAANDDWPSGDAVACAGIDQGVPRDSALVVGVRGGVPLWIRVSRYDASGGNEFRLAVELEPESIATAPLPPGPDCAPGSRTAVTAIPGSLLDLDAVPMVLVTSCFVPASQGVRLELLDPRTAPATLLRTIDVSPSPAFGLGTLLLRGDHGDLLACANGPGGEHTVFAIDVSPFDDVPDGTATPLFEIPSLDERCEGLAYDLDARTLYVSTLLPTGPGTSAPLIARYDASGTLLGFLPPPPGCPRVGGLAIGGGPLLAACPEARALHLLDPGSGSVLGEQALAGTGAADLECDPLSFDGAGHETVWWVDSAREQAIASALPGGVCGFAGGRAVRRHALRLGPLCADTNANGNLDDDGDGLCDNWETTGIDWDGDGQIDLRLYDVNKDGTIQSSEQADPRHKDVYVEIDWMAQHQPDAKALAQVVASYAAAPVSNPDGATGVRLHLLVDEEAAPHDATIELPPCTSGSAPAAVPRFDDIKAVRFGTALERAGAGAAARLAAKAAVFRWNLFAHDLHGIVGTSGCSELPGNDFAVTLGDWNVVNGHGVGSTDQQAGTFMHELGHTLGLRHGGAQHVNCKPNYLSLMSYSRQIDNEFVNGRPLDYSRSALPALVESSLSEPAGIGAGAGARTAFGPPPVQSNVDASGAIDWNRDGDATDGGVSRDVNSFGFTGCGPFAGQTLLGFDDWDALQYAFAGSPDAADGVHVTATMEPEVRFDALLSVSPDSEHDGVPNLVDRCPFAADPAQVDRGGVGTGSTPDGIGDACQCGDVTGDGRVTLSDSVAITRSLLQPPTATLARPELCDVGGSTGCTITDAVIVRRALLAPPTATIEPRCAPARP
jgi:hypothetical protein